MAAFAQDGFSHFNTLLARAWDGGRPDPVAALRRRGEAYLAFAREESGLYRAMFGDAALLRRPADNPAARIAFDELVRSAVEVLRFFHAPEQGAETLAMQIWAMSHGVADLMLGGYFPGGAEEAAQTLGAGASALVDGALRKALGVKPVLPAG